MRAARRASSLPMAAAAVALVLSGCSTLSGLEIPREAKVPTPVPCIAQADVPQRPALRTAEDLMALDPYRRTHALWAAYARLWGYAGELAAVVEGCSKIPPAKP